MGAIIVIYFLFPLIKIVYDSRKDIFYFFVIIVFILSFENQIINHVVSIIKHDKVYQYNWFQYLNIFYSVKGYSFVYFCLGGITNDIMNKLVYFNKIWFNIVLILLSMMGLFVIGNILSHVQNETWDVVWYGYDTPYTLINVFCIYSLCLKYKGKESFFRKIILIISQNTLGIYFIHILFISLLYPYIKDINIISNIIGNIVFSLIILFISLSIVLFIKKYLL